jgi:hypothetical protein
MGFTYILMANPINFTVSGVAPRAGYFNYVKCGSNLPNPISINICSSNLGYVVIPADTPSANPGTSILYFDGSNWSLN